MIGYPAFTAAVAERDVDELAATAGIDPDKITAILDGGIPSLSLRDRLARALDTDPVELFRLAPELEQALAAAPTRYITDPATLRIIDRRTP